MARTVIDIKGLVAGYRNGQEIAFRYPAFDAVAHCGELIALVGRNGVGKSTLLRTLTRLKPVLDGAVRINGRYIDDISGNDFARLVSFIPSEPAHASHTNVYEFVCMARYPYHGWFESLQMSDSLLVERAIDSVGLTNLKKRYIDNLSDGERQRAMIAFAIAQDTPIIIMDEPTAFLDLPNKFEVMRLLREQSLQGKTIIISTHDLQTAFGLVDTIWLMLPKGIKIGAPEDLVLSGILNKLVDNTPVYFDAKSGQFVYNQPFKKKAIVVGGTPTQHRWTANALQRLGFETDFTDSSADELFVQICEEEGKVQWKLGRGDRSPTFDSIRNLCLYIKG